MANWRPAVLPDGGIPIRLLSMVNWSALPEDLIVLIARRLQVIEDFVALRSICSSWRAATSLKDFDKSCQRLPLLVMINPKEDGVERQFFSLSKRRRCNISLPEAEGKECIGSKGWFIMIGSSGDMSLLNPITRTQIRLPNSPVQSKAANYIADVRMFPHLPNQLTIASSQLTPIQPIACYDHNNKFGHFLRRAVLSASPSETSDYVVMVVYWNANNKTSYVGFGKPGDPTWTEVELPSSTCSVDKVNYYNGKFYALTFAREVWMYDVLGPNPKKASKIICIQVHRSRAHAYFVECGGRLLLALVPHFNCIYPYFKPSIDGLQMVELDVIKGKCTKIPSLGNSTCVFLDDNEGFTIDTMRFPGVIKPDHIYLTTGFYDLSKPGPGPGGMHKLTPYAYGTIVSSQILRAHDGFWVNF